MQPRLQPTTKQNVAARLFLRYFLFYFAWVLPLSLLVFRLGLSVSRADVGFVQLLLVLLALLGGFLTVSKPYLLVLCAVKAYFDATLLCTVVRACSSLGGAFLSFNALLLYLVFSLVLFCLAAARASVFSFDCPVRDFSLIFSRKCLQFLTECAFLSALSLTLYYIWPQLLAML